MELNEEQQNALALMKSGQNVFLRGDAGTGKTEVINAFIETNPEGICAGRRACERAGWGELFCAHR